jgi:polyferredoxin
LAAVLFFGFKYTLVRHQWDIRGMWWFLAGNALYFGLAVGLAFVLKDNRAFCKYTCPIVTFLKPASSASVLKVRGDRLLCDDCGACARVCPMDIRVNEYAREGRRVLSNECICCLTCVDACPRGALAVAVGLDVCGVSKLRVKP